MKTKIIAALFTALMALTSVSPVLAAYTLGDYPDFLFTDHNLNAYVVAGGDAKPADVVGMTDLAVRLAGESYEEVSAGGLEVSGSKKEEIPLASTLNASAYFGNTMDDSDLSGLQDTTISLTTSAGSEDYDVHDEFRLGNGAGSYVRLDSGLTVASPDEDFKDNIFIDVGRSTVGYYYVFDDDPVSGNMLNDTSSSYPLEIEFLGKTLKITGATATSLTAQVGDQYSLMAGESVTVSGKTFTLDSCTSTPKAVVSCGGTTKTIAEGGTVNLCGLEIYADTVINDDGTVNDQAILIIGTDATKTYTSGDAYIGEDEDNPNWVWDLSGLTSTSSASIKLGIKYDKTLDETDEVINLGEKLCLPNNYICIDVNSLTKDGYQKYTVDTGTEDLYVGTTANYTSAYVFKWHAAGGGKDGFLLGSEKTDDIAIYREPTSNNIYVYYKDPDDNKYKYGASVAINSTDNDPGIKIKYKDTSMSMLIDYYGKTGSETGNMTLSTGLGDDINIYFQTATSGKLEYLGHSDSDTTTGNDLVYGAGKDISGWEENTRAQDGIIIYDPKAHLSGDSFEFDVPEDESDFNVYLIVQGPGGTTTTGGDTIKKVVPITNAVAKLDSEVSLPVTKNLVLVGGPGVNKLTAQAMGLTYPTYGSSGLLPFAQGEGYIKVFDGTLETGKVAVVVAGWEAADTRNACSVLQQYAEFATELGTNAAVKVTSVTSSGITPAT